MKIKHFSRSVLFLLVVFLFGCVSEGIVETGPPDGWQAEDTRWWRTGLDTTGNFRSLETLGSMRVTDADLQYAATPNLARQQK